MFIKNWIERRKCKKDIIYFAENYYKDSSIEGNLKLTEDQKRCLKGMIKNGRLLINGVRRSGKSLIEKIFTVHQLCCHPKTRILFVSLNDRMAQGNFNDIIDSFRLLPFFLRRKCKIENCYFRNIIFKKGGLITFGLYNSIKKGESYDISICDEVDFWDTERPTVISSNKCVYLSSKRSRASWFYKTWKNSMSGHEPIWKADYLDHKMSPHDALFLQKNLGKKQYSIEMEVF